MAETLDGPDIPDDDTLREMVLTGTADTGERGVVALGELAPFDAETAMRGLREAGDPDGPYRQEREVHQLVLGSGAGQVVLSQYELTPDQFVTDSN